MIYYQDCFWIHHWVIIQVVNPLLAVDPHSNLEVVFPNGERRYVFKHKNWSRFIKVVDKKIEKEHRDLHKENPSFGLVWLGERISK
jgi:hypothetical protein